MDRFPRQALYSWAFIAALTALSVLLAILQYRWIGEVSRSEEQRLKSNLRAALERLSVDFNDNIFQSASAVTLSGGGEIHSDPSDLEHLYIEKFKRWQDGTHQERLFASITRIVPGKDGSVVLRQLDQQRVAFHSIDWPDGWASLHDEIRKQISNADDGASLGPPRVRDLDLILVPLFSRPPGEGPPESRRDLPVEWVAFEVDLNYVRSVLMPELMDHLTRAVGPGYDAELTSRNDAATIIYQSDPERAGRIAAAADAQVRLFDDHPRPPDRPSGSDADQLMRGRWLLSVRHQAGSLDAMVARTRLRNIAVTTAVLALMLLTITALVRFTRRAQTLSQLQMQFVAGVSHELRTPLTVIRTAAHNLSTGIVKMGDVDHVQRYGRLIGSQTDKLSALVEQVLGFANAESGRVISKREPIAIESLIEQALADCETAIIESRCAIESNIAPNVAPLWGDPVALRHALQNLLTNAAKYGADGQWIGVSAAMANGKKGQPVVEIRVADRGAGIPADERSQIFEPFYRGRRAVDDQVHGTGLGLALVKRIVEAHGGTIGVEPGPGQRGTEFTLRIPPAPSEQVDEFADTTS